MAPKMRPEALEDIQAEDDAAIAEIQRANSILLGRSSSQPDLQVQRETAAQRRESAAIRSHMRLSAPQDSISTSPGRDQAEWIKVLTAREAKVAQGENAIVKGRESLRKEQEVLRVDQKALEEAKLAFQDEKKDQEKQMKEVEQREFTLKEVETALEEGEAALEEDKGNFEAILRQAKEAQEAALKQAKNHHEAALRRDKENHEAARKEEYCQLDVKKKETEGKLWEAVELQRETQKREQLVAENETALKEHINEFNGFYDEQKARLQAWEEALSQREADVEEAIRTHPRDVAASKEEVANRDSDDTQQRRHLQSTEGEASRAPIASDPEAKEGPVGNVPTDQTLGSRTRDDNSAAIQEDAVMGVNDEENVTTIQNTIEELTSRPGQRLAKTQVLLLPNLQLPARPAVLYPGSTIQDERFLEETATPDRATENAEASPFGWRKEPGKLIRVVPADRAEEYHRSVQQRLDRLGSRRTAELEAEVADGQSMAIRPEEEVRDWDQSPQRWL